jgi:hypothetical protein
VRRAIVIGVVLIASVARADFILKQDGTRVGSARDIDCSTNMTCSVSGNTATLTCAGGGGGGGAPTTAEYITYASNASLSAERVLSAGNYTSVDLGTAAQAQVDWAHGLTCSSGQALTSSGTSAMVCTSTLTASDVQCSGTCVADSEIAAMAASKLTGTVAVTKGGTGVATVAANQVLVGTAADTVAAKTVPSCSDPTTSKVLYNDATQTWSCGTDQTGSGGSNVVEVEVDFGSGGNDTASTTVTGQAWVTATSKILCTPTMFATTDRAEGAEDILIEDLDVATHTRVASTGFTVTAHAGQGITFGKFIFHCTGG